ncbi:MAG TPA: TMEM165/GDT1 family protein [candidate division WOR-3 bacterium]|uniref:GDT1 family protein n=1 Tax=candidate division WOR-3 bacterium TaxID=2052148 RepID=A0A7V0XEF7_UNCW3|nr:TMEM165/GDT1 family protein [candidate division WOR-3 bacterium]
MNWRLMLLTFGTVFLAELGDKTQLAMLAFAAANRSFWSVFVGSALALVLASVLAMLVGTVLARCLPARWVSLGAGVLFIVIGAVLVARNLRPVC